MKRSIWVVVALVTLGIGTTAQASFIIVPTFSSSITSDSGATCSIEGAINAAIGSIESSITSPNNITVSIYFNAVATGLGESETGFYGVSYDAYYNALKAVATQPNQLTALASLGTAPTSAGSLNPVNGTAQIDITSAEARNLGFSTAAPVVTVGSGTYDSEISLNTLITSPPNGLAGFYGLESVANHEIDEALGIGGTGSTIGGTGFFSNPGRRRDWGCGGRGRIASEGAAGAALERACRLCFASALPSACWPKWPSSRRRAWRRERSILG